MSTNHIPSVEAYLVSLFEDTNLCVSSLLPPSIPSDKADISPVSGDPCKGMWLQNFHPELLKLILCFLARDNPVERYSAGSQIAWGADLSGLWDVWGGCRRCFDSDWTYVGWLGSFSIVRIDTRKYI